MEKIDEVTARLGAAHNQWKEGEKAKNKAKEEFFQLATDKLKEELQDQRIEKVEARDEEEALRIAQRRFHRHNIVDVRTDGGIWEIVIEEDPNLKPFSHVNREDGNVYARSISEGSPLLDDDAIREENPELWEKISHDVIRREMKSLEDLSDEEIVEIQPYLYQPRPTVRLNSPRKAKPEELDPDE